MFLKLRGPDPGPARPGGLPGWGPEQRPSFSVGWERCLLDRLGRYSSNVTTSPGVAHEKPGDAVSGVQER